MYAIFPKIKGKQTVDVSDMVGEKKDNRKKTQ